MAAPSFYTAPLPRQNVTNPPSPLLLFLFGTTAVRRWVEARLTDFKLSSAAYRNNQPRGLSTTNPRLAQLHCMGRLHERGNRKPSKLVTAKWGGSENDASHTNPTLPCERQIRVALVKVTRNREHCYWPEKCKQRLRLAPPLLQARTHEQTNNIRFGKPGLRSEPPRQSGAHPRSKLAATN